MLDPACAITPAQKCARHTRTPGPASSNGGVAAKGRRHSRTVDSSRGSSAGHQATSRQAAGQAASPSWIAPAVHTAGRAGLAAGHAVAVAAEQGRLHTHTHLPPNPHPPHTMLKKSASWAPCTAASRSASSHTTTGELPPSSRVTGLMFLAAPASGSKRGQKGGEKGRGLASCGGGGQA